MTRAPNARVWLGRPGSDVGSCTNARLGRNPDLRPSLQLARFVPKTDILLGV
jgi:hypothetical protein